VRLKPFNSAFDYRRHFVPSVGTGHTRSMLDGPDNFARLSLILCQFGRRVASPPHGDPGPNDGLGGRAEILGNDIDLRLMDGSCRGR